MTSEKFSEKYDKEANKYSLVIPSYPNRNGTNSQLSSLSIDEDSQMSNSFNFDTASRPSNNENIHANVRAKNQHTCLSSHKEYAKRKNDAVNSSGITAQNDQLVKNKKNIVTHIAEANIGPFVPIISYRNPFKSIYNQSKHMPKKGRLQINSKMAPSFTCDMASKRQLQRIEEEIVINITTPKTISGKKSDSVFGEVDDASRSPPHSKGYHQTYYNDDGNDAQLHSMYASVPNENDNPPCDDMTSNDHVTVYLKDTLRQARSHDSEVEFISFYKGIPNAGEKSKYDDSTSGNNNARLCLQDTLDQARTQDSEEDFMSFIGSLREEDRDTCIPVEKRMPNFYAAAKCMIKEKSQAEIMNEKGNQNRIQNNQTSNAMLPESSLNGIRLDVQNGETPSKTDEIESLPVAETQVMIQVGMKTNDSEINQKLSDNITGEGDQCSSIDCDRHTTHQISSSSIILTSLAIEEDQNIALDYTPLFNSYAQFVPSTLDQLDKNQHGQENIKQKKY